MTSNAADPSALSLTWVGHSTVVVDLDGLRLLTDPLLRPRVAHLRRLQPLSMNVPERIDAILISHGHYDHLDVASLRKLDPSIPIVAPRGLASVLRRAGRTEVVEAEVGDEAAFGDVVVHATPAEHSGEAGLRRSEVLGFLIRGSSSVYFAGDTDLFEEMGDLAPVDLALVPIWGWGPAIGPGHLDPERAAEAVALLGARTAVPIHWGTYFPLHQRPGAFLTEPPLEFERAAAQVAPETRVEILALGETIELLAGRPVR
jgi:L-ascorbate metabolism protein UlaG (beta-lactamase superfamily)